MIIEFVIVYGNLLQHESGKFYLHAPSDCQNVFEFIKPIVESWLSHANPVSSDQGYFLKLLDVRPKKKPE